MNSQRQEMKQRRDDRPFQKSIIDLDEIVEKWVMNR